jgi:hypothetical protein
VDDGSRDQFELYAWKLFPFEFDDAERRPAVLPSLHVQPLPASFELLGYDIVSRYSSGSCFECSPLSCNHLAEEIAVNRHCLLADAPTALRLASEFETMGGEPGPCLVVEVWRQRRAVS